MSATVPTKAEFDALVARVLKLEAAGAVAALNITDLDSRLALLETATVVPPVIPPPVVTPPPSGGNEPAGLTLIEQQDWTTPLLTSIPGSGPGWWLNPSPGKTISIIQADGPNGPAPILRLAFPQGASGGGGTELGRWISPVNELYWHYAVRVNPQWQGHASGINKMVYLNDAGSGGFSAMWYEMYGGGQAPLGLYVVNQSGDNIGYVEAQQRPIFSRGVWHDVEIYQRQGQPGQLKVWVDGVLQLDRQAITRANPIGLLVVSGIWGGVGDTKQQADYMDFGPMRISGR